MGKRDSRDDFLPFLCSPTLSLILQVIRYLQFMISVSPNDTLNVGRRQEFEELWLRFLQTREKAFIRGGMRYNKKSGYEVSKKKAVLNLAQNAVFYVFHCGPVATQPFIFQVA